MNMQASERASLSVSEKVGGERKGSVGQSGGKCEAGSIFIEREKKALALSSSLEPPSLLHHACPIQTDSRITGQTTGARSTTYNRTSQCCMQSSVQGSAPFFPHPGSIEPDHRPAAIRLHPLLHIRPSQLVSLFLPTSDEAVHLGVHIFCRLRAAKGINEFALCVSSAAP